MTYFVCIQIVKFLFKIKDLTFYRTTRIVTPCIYFVINITIIAVTVALILFGRRPAVLKPPNDDRVAVVFVIVAVVSRCCRLNCVVVFFIFHLVGFVVAPPWRATLSVNETPPRQTGYMAWLCEPERRQVKRQNINK